MVNFQNMAQILAFFDRTGLISVCFLWNCPRFTWNLYSVTCV